LSEVDPAKLVPFLTCKHTLDYCLMYATRAYSAGYQALVVLGGDKEVGTPRCLPHAFELREKIRERHPGLVLGGWANPHADPVKQVDYLLDPRFTADFVLTQVVSHHDLPQVEAFLAEARRREVQVPIVFGTFYYRSAKAKTLSALSEFMPVPLAGLQADFAAGLTPSQICARTIQGLRDLGADKVYVSNLGHGRARRRMKLIREQLSPG
jgi:5,10-methylenetetrahydrofolate reductase